MHRRLAEAEAQNKEATETIKKLEAYNEMTNDALDALRLDEGAKLSGGMDVAAQTDVNEAALYRQEESAQKLAQCQRRLASEKEKSASLEASLRSQQRELERARQDDDKCLMLHLRIEELKLKIGDRNNTVLSLRSEVMSLQQQDLELRQHQPANERDDSSCSQIDSEDDECVASLMLTRCNPDGLQCVQRQEQPVPLIPRQSWSEHRERLRRVGVWTCGDKSSRYMAYQKLAFVVTAVAYTYQVLHIMSPNHLSLTPDEIEVVERNMDIMAKDLETNRCVFSQFKDIPALVKAAKKDLPKFADKAKQLLKNGKNTWSTLQEKKDMNKTHNLHKHQRDIYAEIGFFAPIKA